MHAYMHAYTEAHMQTYIHKYVEWLVAIFYGGMNIESVITIVTL